MILVFCSNKLNAATEESMKFFLIICQTHFGFVGIENHWEN